MNNIWQEPVKEFNELDEIIKNKNNNNYCSFVFCFDDIAIIMMIVI
jgi:hypothetical protein